MKTALASQFQTLKVKPKSEAKHPSKTALETVNSNAAFGQIWNAFLKPKSHWKGFAAKAGNGEIEIPLAPQKQTDKPQSPSLQKTAESKTAKVKKTGLQENQRKVSQKEKNTVERSHASASARTQSKEVSGADGLDKTQTKSRTTAEKAKHIARRILNALQKRSLLPDVKVGELARVEIEFSKNTRSNSNHKNASAKLPVEIRKTTNTNQGQTAESRKIKYNLRLTERNGWQKVDGTLAMNRGKVWKFRIILPKSMEFDGGTALKAELVAGKATGTASEKEMQITVRSLGKKANPSLAKKMSPSASQHAVAENGADSTGEAAPKSSGTGRIVTLELNNENILSASSGSQKLAKGQAQANAMTNGETTGEESQTNAPSKNNDAIPQAKEKAGQTKSVGIKSDTMATGGKAQRQEMAKAQSIKGQAKIGSKPSVLIERIELLLSKTAKGKNSGGLKMQLTESPFGKMDIQFDSKERRLSVSVESDRAKEAFLRLAPLIRSHLADKGFVLNEVQVAVGQYAAREKREGAMDKGQTQQSGIQQKSRKEAEEHEKTSTVNLRKFGYNTLEVTA